LKVLEFLLNEGPWIKPSSCLKYNEIDLL